MSRVRVGIAIVLVVVFAAVIAGCGGDDNASTTTAAPGTTAATTTAATTTAATTTAATTTAATTTAATTTAATTTEETGDVAEGSAFFVATCQGCHLAGGTQAGAGPVLAGGGRTEERIRNQVINGGGAMPAGLATGADLDNVVAFVLSIQ